ncbi:hypothetical protein KIH79_11075 [Bifidobacterium sp. 82T10]|uniref:Secreted protein n=1 Tax=Bifidobacterium miconis TaxID=2834435 RepID=A0ABS6WHC1_9BIFI|nr:hypothetical protein [Bifidobacterium miconis]MBW3093451.1 hypothetical protein [Bifidobacterium miconis]
MTNNDRRPLVLIDFDGVINQFPDEKVRRRQNSTTWMKPGDPRIPVYDPANWFIPDHTDKAWAGRYHGRLKITWSGELVERLNALDAQILWLSTWQPYIDTLNPKLGVTWPTLHWYDPVTREGRYTGKRRMVLNHLALGRPIVWIDDEETTYQAGLAIQAHKPTAPVLAVGPDSCIGISRPQMDLIERFVAQPPEEPTVRFEVTGEGHEGHWGF